jgi:uncharacterized membrane protein HdeD (DUF308 family)
VYKRHNRQGILADVWQNTINEIILIKELIIFALLTINYFIMNKSFIKGSSIYMLLHGLIAIILGFAFIFIDTKEIASTVMQIIGILIILIGIIIIWRSLRINSISGGKMKYPIMMQGILLTAVGLFTTLYSDLMINLIMLFLGIWAIISGGFQTYYGIKAKDYINSNKILIINGIFLLIIGFIIAFRHELFLNMLGTIIGVISLLTGITTLVFAWMMYKMRNEFDSSSDNFDDAEVIK